MSVEKNMNTRIQHKHDVEVNWNKATNFIPKNGEIIIYDVDNNYTYNRIKIGDGITSVKELQFFANEKFDNNIDYKTLLSFDTTEIVFNSTTSILGQAILGQIILP